jgi:pteridine reductase
MATDRPAALITGAARRIGGAIAETLHVAGFDIALHYRSAAAEAQALSARLNAARPGSCTLHRADLGERLQLAQLANEVGAEHPGLAVLVNNASGFQAQAFADTADTLFDAMLDSNLRGAFFLTRDLVPALASNRGCIVNILDMHLDRPVRGYSAYTAAKAGLAALTRSLAVELAPAIRVNGVAPGVILWPDGEAPFYATVREETVARTPLQRMGEPTDIARTVCFLVTDAPFITGQVITVDGGLSLV